MIEELEKAWRRAYHAMRADDNDRATAAEQQAWDAMVDAKNAADLCYEPGCRATTGEYCYCSKHGPRS